MPQESYDSSAYAFCPRCGEVLIPSALFCSRCAEPVQRSNKYDTPTVATDKDRRKVGPALGLGIFFFPYIFSWLTLRRGYSTLARGISFSWLIILFLTFQMGRPSRLDNQSSIPASSYTSPGPAIDPKAKARQLVRLDYKWNKTAFGSIMEADFTIENLSDYAIKDIEIICTHFANSGTKIDSNTRTVYELVPAKGKKVVRNFNMGFIHSQVTSTSCQIDDFVLTN